MKSRMFRLFAFGLLVSLGGLTACDRADDDMNANRTQNTNAVVNTNTAETTPVADRDDEDYDTPDGIVTAKTKLALMADERVSAFEVDVDTVANVVTLSGTVDTDVSKKAAEQIAKGIDGVKSVTNALQVVPESKAEAVNEKDDTIQNSIDDILDNDKEIADLDVAAKVNAGVVTLTGSVDNMSEKMRAANAIRKVKGVKRVVTTALNVDKDKMAGDKDANDNGNRKSR